MLFVAELQSKHNSLMSTPQSLPLPPGTGPKQELQASLTSSSPSAETTRIKVADSLLTLKSLTA